MDEIAVGAAAGVQKSCVISRLIFHDALRGNLRLRLQLENWRHSQLSKAYIELQFQFIRFMFIFNLRN